MSNMDLLRELVKQRLSEAADEVFDLFLKSIDEYKEQIRSQNRILIQTPDIECDSAKSRESLEQRSCNSSVDLPISFSKQIKQEPAEPKGLWNHVEELQQLAEAFPPTAFQINNTVNEIQTESSESTESQVQQECNPRVDLKFPLQIKEEPPEPKALWEHQEDQHQEVNASPSSTVQINENQTEDQFLTHMEVGAAADPVLEDGPHMKASEQQPWSSNRKQEHNGAEEESTKSLVAAVKSEEANSSLPLQSEPDGVGYEEPMETESAGEDAGEEDGGGSEAAQRSASEKTANSSETEDSEDEWDKPKHALSKIVKIVRPEPVPTESKDESKNPSPPHPEIKTDVISEPVSNPAPPRDPASEDMTSDSSDAESENSSHQRKMSTAKPDQLSEAASSSKSHSEKKMSQKSSKKKSKKPKEKPEKPRVKKPEKQRLPCPRCGKEFIYMSNLYRHLRSHSESKGNVKKSVDCSVCGKRYSDQVFLDLHMRVHNVSTGGMKTGSQDKVKDSSGAG